MSSLSQMFASSQRLSLPAREEAVLASRQLVGVEDLFLALFSAGGESSRFLAGAGVDLAAARRAIAAVHSDRIAALGIGAEPLEPQPGSRRASLAAQVDFSEAAQTVLRDVSAYDDDRQVLIAAARSADGVVQEALDRLGIDTAALREQLEAETSALATTDSSAPAKPALIDDEEGTWLRVTVPWHLAASPAEVRALLTDPEQWERWNYGEGDLEVDAEGTVSMTDPERSRWLALLGIAQRRSRHQLVDTGDLTAVMWDTAVESVTSSPKRRRPSRQRLVIRLALTASGTAATFESDWLLTRRRSSARRRVLGHILRSRATAQASALARVLSESTDLSE